MAEKGNIMKKWLQKQGLLKKNYKNDMVPTGGGLLFIFSCVIVWSIFLIAGIGEKEVIINYIFLTIIIGLTGFIDDIAGNKKNQGFRKHFKKILDKKLTTGCFKVIISTVTVSLVIYEKNYTYYGFLLVLLLIILMTNFLNLLDLRPGRSIKFFILGFLFVVITLPEMLLYFIPFIILLPYLAYELKGQIMMGDTGANVLGVILGYTFSFWVNQSGLIVMILSLLILNLLSEKYSFTKIIKENKILNWLDKIGRK